jgi:hypothetical protein
MIEFMSLKMTIILFFYRISFFFKFSQRTAAPQYVVGKTISKGYRLPSAKQGVDDERYFTTFARDQKWVS